MGLGEEDAVRDPLRALPQLDRGPAQPLDMHIHGQHVARKRRRQKLDRGLADRRPHLVTDEDVRPWSPSQGLPARALEDREIGGFVQVPIRVALVRVDSDFD